MVHQFDNIELEKHYVFFEYLRKKFPVDGNERIDVSDLVDLESLNLDIKGKLNISLEDEDTYLTQINMVTVKEKMKRSMIYFLKLLMK